MSGGRHSQAEYGRACLPPGGVVLQESPLAEHLHPSRSCAVEVGHRVLVRGVAVQAPSHRPPFFAGRQPFGPFLQEGLGRFEKTSYLNCLGSSVGRCYERFNIAVSDQKPDSLGLRMQLHGFDE